MPLEPEAASRVKVFSQHSEDLSNGRRSADEPTAPVIDFTQFDHPAHGATGVPLPPMRYESTEESRNEPIRDLVLGRLNAHKQYRELFQSAFPNLKSDQAITFAHVAQAIAEFEFTLTFANAPLDKFARGDRSAMTQQQKRGAIVFFGQASCVQCHAVAGPSNEMFSDFQMHVAAIPQIAPKFGRGLGNVPFRNAEGQLAENGNQDFGLFDITEQDADMYKFRTSPLRNIAAHRPSFTTEPSRGSKMHCAITSAPWRSRSNTIPPKLASTKTSHTTPDRSHSVAKTGSSPPGAPGLLSEEDIQALLVFLRDGPLDSDARPENLRKLIPATVPSGLPLHKFQDVSPAP